MATWTGLVINIEDAEAPQKSIGITLYSAGKKWETSDPHRLLPEANTGVFAFVGGLVQCYVGNKSVITLEGCTPGLTQTGDTGDASVGDNTHGFVWTCTKSV